MTVNTYHSHINRIIIFTCKLQISDMSRRNVSPVRGRVPVESTLPPGIDERDIIIKKLKQELIIARSKQKEVVILENYLAEIRQKIRTLTEDLKRKDVDIKSKNDSSQRGITDLKREVDVYKGELKNSTIQLGEKQAQIVQMKRHLAKRTTEVEKCKKQTLYLKDENERLLQEGAVASARAEQIQGEIIRIQSTNRNYEGRISQMNSRIGQVKAYIGDLNNEARILKQRLKKHQQENNQISDDLNHKQDNIDQLERVFTDKHDQIKNQIDTYIQLQHKNERLLTQIRHKINLNKAENQKANQLNIQLQKIEKAIATLTRESQKVEEEIKQLIEKNNEYSKINSELTQDLAKSEAHLQNLMKYNSYIQEELERYLREDEQIIAVIRRKRAVDFVPLRESRKFTERTYV